MWANALVACLVGALAGLVAGQAGQVSTVAIVGERHVGTTWVQHQLEQCFAQDGLVFRPGLTRFKFWFQLDDRKARADTLTVVLFRGPHAWLEAMRSRPEHSPAHWNATLTAAPGPQAHRMGRPLQWETFYSRPWELPRSAMASDTGPSPEGHVHFGRRAECQRGYSRTEVMPCSARPDAHPSPSGSESDATHKATQKEAVDHGRPTPPLATHRQAHRAVYELHGNGIPYANILALRAAKLRNHADIARWAKGPVLLLRWEDLIENGTEALLQRVEQLSGISRQCQAASPQKEQPNSPEAPSSKAGRPSDDLAHRQFLQRSIDWEAEALAGFHATNPAAPPPRSGGGPFRADPLGALGDTPEPGHHDGECPVAVFVVSRGSHGLRADALVLARALSLTLTAACVSIHVDTQPPRPVTHSDVIITLEHPLNHTYWDNPSGLSMWRVAAKTAGLVIHVPNVDVSNMADHDNSGTHLVLCKTHFTCTTVTQRAAAKRTRGRGCTSHLADSCTTPEAGESEPGAVISAVAAVPMFYTGFTSPDPFPPAGYDDTGFPVVSARQADRVHAATPFRVPETASDNAVLRSVIDGRDAARDAVRDWHEAVQITGDSFFRKKLPETVVAWGRVAAAGRIDLLPKLVALGTGDVLDMGLGYVSTGPDGVPAAVAKLAAGAGQTAEQAAALNQSVCGELFRRFNRTDPTSHEPTMRGCTAAPSFGYIRGKLSRSNVTMLMATRGVHLVFADIEGFGHAQNEARASAAMIMSTDRPPMNEMIRDGETGILTRGTDAVDIVEAVGRLANLSLGDRRRCGAAARRAFERDRYDFFGKIGRLVAIMSDRLVPGQDFGLTEDERALADRLPRRNG